MLFSFVFLKTQRHCICAHYLFPIESLLFEQSLFFEFRQFHLLTFYTLFLFLFLLQRLQKGFEVLGSDWLLLAGLWLISLPQRLALLGKSLLFCFDVHGILADFLDYFGVLWHCLFFEKAAFRGEGRLLLNHLLVVIVVAVMLSANSFTHLDSLSCCGEIFAFFVCILVCCREKKIEANVFIKFIFFLLNFKDRQNKNVHC